MVDNIPALFPSFSCRLPYGETAKMDDLCSEGSGSRMLHATTCTFDIVSFAMWDSNMAITWRDRRGSGVLFSGGRPLLHVRLPSAKCHRSGSDKSSDLSLPFSPENYCLLRSQPKSARGWTFANILFIYLLFACLFLGWLDQWLVAVRDFFTE